MSPITSLNFLKDSPALPVQERFHQAASNDSVDELQLLIQDRSLLKKLGKSDFTSALQVCIEKDHLDAFCVIVKSDFFKDLIDKEALLDLFKKALSQWRLSMIDELIRLPFCKGTLDQSIGQLFEHVLDEMSYLAIPKFLSTDWAKALSDQEFVKGVVRMANRTHFHRFKMLVTDPRCNGYAVALISKELTEDQACYLAEAAQKILTYENSNGVKRVLGIACIRLLSCEKIQIFPIVKENFLKITPTDWYLGFSRAISKGQIEHVVFALCNGVLDILSTQQRADLCMHSCQASVDYPQTLVIARCFFQPDTWPSISKNLIPRITALAIRTDNVLLLDILERNPQFVMTMEFFSATRLSATNLGHFKVAQWCSDHEDLLREIN